MHCYVVGGVRVSTPGEANLERAGYADLDLEVALGEVTAPPGSPWLALDPEADRALAGPAWASWDAEARAVWIRSVVPFAAARRGLVTFHASAALTGSRTLAFVGESGAGKSTLASVLATQGHVVLADDLLPVRVIEGTLCIPSPGGTGLVPLDTLYFLERRPSAPAAAFTRLAPTYTVQRLVRHGFGEWPEPDIMRAQFETYGLAARQVPAFDLVLPDDLGALPAVVEALAAHASRSLP